MTLGFEGSGNHSIYNQLNNMILTIFCPLAIDYADVTKVWEQKSPNAQNTERPISLQIGKVLVFNDAISNE